MAAGSELSPDRDAPRRPPRGRARRALLSGLLLLLAWLSISPRAPAGRPADALPDRLSDRAFWRLVEEMSEPGGSFRSDNLLSNEESFQHVIPALERQLPPGGVYLGVGPDQNFTYITALRPKMAFVVDIRRQNMLLHLMYKALLELSPDRVRFLSRLFSRPVPAGLTADISPRDLFDAFETSPPSGALFALNLQAVRRQLVAVHGFGLSADDLSAIEYVYRAFYQGGPDLRYSFPRQGFGGRGFPSYAELMLATDRAGIDHSYLASDENFRTLRRYETDNLVVPIVGDFGGDRALKALGRYLADHGATVTLFYTSNVEQYLFQNGDQWRRFFENVSALPTDGRSTVLRSYFNMGGVGIPAGSRPGPGGLGSRSGMLVDSIPDLLDAVRNGRITSYYDVIEHSR